MQHFKVEILFSIHGDGVLTPFGAETLLLEQWSQTPALEEGDAIRVVQIEEVTSDENGEELL
jgi:hypothetical protein